MVSSVGRKRQGFAVLVAILIVAGWFTWNLHSPRTRESYRGKTVEEWLDKFDYDRNFVDGEGRRLASFHEDVSALKTFGTNIVPILLRHLETKDTRVRLLVQGIGRKFYPAIPVSNRRLVHFFQSASSEQELAREVFQELPTMAERALPEFRVILRQQDFNPKLNMLNLIGTLGTNAASAYPEVMAYLEGDDSRLRLNALGAVGTMGVVTPRLTACLFRFRSDPDKMIRGNAEGAIKRLGLEHNPNFNADK